MTDMLKLIEDSLYSYLPNKNVLDSCAAILIKKEKLTREEFEALFETNN